MKVRPGVPGLGHSPRQGCDKVPHPHNPKRTDPMKLLIDLFSTDYGLMSLAVILFVLVMAGYFYRLFMNQIKGS